MNRKSRIGLIIAAAAAGGMMLWGWNAAGPSEEKERETGILQQQTVTRGDLETLVSSTGTLVAVGTVDIGTQVSGTIDRVLVDYNDRVSRDQVLAVLDLSLFEAAVDEARAGLIQARARLKQARAELARNRDLFESGNLSAQEYLDLETAVELNRAGVLSAEATLKRAQSNLDNATIASPIDGTVITRSIEAGQTVAASYSTPTLFVIAEDLSRMQIEADVDESDIGLVRLDQRVRFTVQAYPDEVFGGVVTQIRLNPKTVSNVVTYTVMVDADNREGRLLPGMTATTDFVVARAEAVLLVPNAALRFRPEHAPETGRGPGVYVPRADGGLRRIAVTPGISDGVLTAVDGETELAEGMAVITGRTLEKNTAKKGLLSRLTPPRPGHPRR
ncbi:efflux RND transporter periplasmic adaptor subunit [Desulfatiferula olefinivorans]